MGCLTRDWMDAILFFMQPWMWFSFKCFFYLSLCISALWGSGNLVLAHNNFCGHIWMKTFFLCLVPNIWPCFPCHLQNILKSGPNKRRGKTSFVEHRTFLHLYHSFHRLWIFLFMMFQVKKLIQQSFSLSLWILSHIFFCSSWNYYRLVP